MNKIALATLRKDHASLLAALHSMLLDLAQHRSDQSLPDFARLRAMLFYVDEFSRWQHHRKESELLFPRLRARTPLAREALNRLELDHLQGEQRIRHVEHALLAFEILGEPRRAAFEQAAQAYVDFYSEHMALEETQILPLAEQVLTAADWDELAAAFRQPMPALFGEHPETDYAALFQTLFSGRPQPAQR